MTKLYVTAFATTASNLEDVNVNNTLFVISDPDGSSMGRVYWEGRQVTGITVVVISHGSLVATVEAGD